MTSSGLGTMGKAYCTFCDVLCNCLQACVHTISRDSLTFGGKELPLRALSKLPRPNAPAKGLSRNTVRGKRSSVKRLLLSQPDYQLVRVSSRRVDSPSILRSVYTAVFPRNSGYMVRNRRYSAQHFAAWQSPWQDESRTVSSNTAFRTSKKIGQPEAGRRGRACS
jgi:hypothetical protein